MVTSDQAIRAFTLFAHAEAAKLRGQQLVTLYVRPGCAQSQEAEAFLTRCGFVYLTRDITIDEGAQDYFRTAGYRTTPQIYVGERPVVGGIGGLKQMGAVAFGKLVETRRPAAAVGTRTVAGAPVDTEVRELLASLAETASAIAARTTSALRFGGHASTGEGQPLDSIHRIGLEVGGFIEVMTRLAALGAIPSEMVRMGAELKRHQFVSPATR